MVENLQDDRYSLNAEKAENYVPTAKKESDSEDIISSDEDSIFQGDVDRDEGFKYSLIDSVKKRRLVEGSKVKLQITKVIVTDENIISSVKLL